MVLGDSQPVASEVKVDDGDSDNKNRWRGIGCLVGITLAVSVALLLGFQLISVLYSILSPPNPPLPDNVTELSHDNIAYGVDEWLYSIDEDGCVVLDYFVEQGATCVVAPGACTENGFESSSSAQNIGSCSGEVEFSIFLMRWESVISTGYRSSNRTRFQMEREVLWSSNSPVNTSTPSLD